MKTFRLPTLLALLLTVTVARADEATDLAAVRSVVLAYKQSLEALDATPAKELFAADSQVFESGGAEGTFAQYLDHHIGPELAEFKEFSFRDHRLDVRMEPPLALVTETYIYKIVLKEDGRVIERRGVATSVLRKIDGRWKFIQTHSSSRALPNK